jgi:protoheme IX farnesyltransferase
MLIVFTAIVGMFMAVPGWPGVIALLFGTLGIGMAASCGAVVNHVLDARIDINMSRTKRRPLPQGWLVINPLTAVLTFASLIGYAVVYTVYLKRSTPQNIVIGGAAGATPPILGWTAVTGEISSDAILLFLIIFVWTPPHFWALAIAKKEEYERVNIPMLPVTHGNEVTRKYILFYTALLVFVTMLPYATGMSGLIYLVTAIALGSKFLYYAISLRSDDGVELPMRVFRYSINYLMFLYAALLIDHYFIFRLPL